MMPSPARRLRQQLKYNLRMSFTQAMYAQYAFRNRLSNPSNEIEQDE